MPEFSSFSKEEGLVGCHIDTAQWAVSEESLQKYSAIFDTAHMQAGISVQETHTNIRDATPDGHHHQIHLVEVDTIGPYVIETILTLSQM